MISFVGVATKALLGIFVSLFAIEGLGDMSVNGDERDDI